MAIGGVDGAIAGAVHGDGGEGFFGLLRNRSTPVAYKFFTFFVPKSVWEGLAVQGPRLLTFLGNAGMEIANEAYTTDAMNAADDEREGGFEGATENDNDKTGNKIVLTSILDPDGEELWVDPRGAQAVEASADDLAIYDVGTHADSKEEEVDFSAVQQRQIKTLTGNQQLVLRRVLGIDVTNATVKKWKVSWFDDGALVIYRPMSTGLWEIDEAGIEASRVRVGLAWPDIKYLLSADELIEGILVENLTGLTQAVVRAMDDRFLDKDHVRYDRASDSLVVRVTDNSRELTIDTDFKRAFIEALVQSLEGVTDITSVSGFSGLLRPGVLEMGGIVEEDTFAFDGTYLVRMGMSGDRTYAEMEDDLKNEWTSTAHYDDTDGSGTRVLTETEAQDTLDFIFNLQARVLIRSLDRPIAKQYLTSIAGTDSHQVQFQPPEGYITGGARDEGKLNIFESKIKSDGAAKQRYGVDEFRQAVNRLLDDASPAADSNAEKMQDIWDGTVQKVFDAASAEDIADAVTQDHLILPQDIESGFTQKCLNLLPYLAGNVFFYQIVAGQTAPDQANDKLIVSSEPEVYELDGRYIELPIGEASDADSLNACVNYTGYISQLAKATDAPDGTRVEELAEPHLSITMQLGAMVRHSDDDASDSGEWEADELEEAEEGLKDTDTIYWEGGALHRDNRLTSDTRELANPTTVKRDITLRIGRERKYLVSADMSSASAAARGKASEFMRYFAEFAEIEVGGAEVSSYDYDELGIPITRKFFERTGYQEITFRNGFMNHAWLYQWCMDTDNGVNYRRDGFIVMFDRSGMLPMRLYKFKDAMPVSWTGAPLDAAGGEDQPLDEITIACNGFSVAVMGVNGIGI